MRNRTARWLAALGLTLMLAVGTVGSRPHTPVVYGEETTPTPTPTEDPNGQPGGSGGGHG